MNQNEIIAQKKESSDESSKSSKSDGSDSESSEDDKKEEEIATPKSYKQMNRFVSSSKLEKILEGDEENYSTNKETKESIDDPHELISHLKSKIEELENEISNLKDKNDTLKKDNIKNDTKLRRMSFVGIRKKFTFSSKGGADQVKMAELLREKSDLQEINDKM